MPGKELKAEVETKEAEPWRDAAYQLPPRGLPSLLSYTQDQLARVGSTHSGALPMSIIATVNANH